MLIKTKFHCKKIKASSERCRSETEKCRILPKKQAARSLGCDCDCGSTVSLGYLKRHRHTKTHFVNLWNLLSSGQISDEQHKSFYEKSKHKKKKKKKPNCWSLKLNKEEINDTRIITIKKV